MGDMTDDNTGNPILKASPESQALVKRLFQGMSPEDRESLMADLRERAKDIEKLKDPAFREWLAENHRRNVSEINRQTMAERAAENAAPDPQDNAPKSIMTAGLEEVFDEIRVKAEESEKQDAQELAAKIGRENMH